MGLHVKSVLLTLILFMKFSILGTTVQIYNNTNLMFTTLPDNGEMYPGDSIITAIDTEQKDILQSPHDWVLVGIPFNNTIIMAIKGIQGYRVAPLQIQCSQIDPTIFINKRGPHISLSLKK